MEKFNIKSFVEGYLEALCAPARQFLHREPVAFLYNGVRLPPLPEWDKEAYPYACIFWYRNGEEPPYYAGLYLASKSEHVYNENGVWSIQAEYLFQFDTYSDTSPGVWIDSGASSDYAPAVELADWANFDLINEDGTVCLAASEPIPIYE